MTQTDRAARFRRHGKGLFVAYLVALLVVLELALRLVAGTGLLRYRTFAVSSAASYIGYVHPEFGLWHHADARHRHRSLCFDVTVRSNSYGARDRERTRETASIRRFVVLGDSFVEGFGSERDKRWTDLAEEVSGIEFLNFGVNEGYPIHSVLVYEHLASSFEHSEVIALLSPENDWMNSDPDRNEPGLFLPYLIEDDTGTWDVWFPVSFEDRQSKKVPMSRGRVIRNRLCNGIYALNILCQVALAPPKLQDPGGAVDRGGPVFYDDYTDRDADILLESYRRLLRITGERPVTVFVLPSRADFEGYLEGRNQFRVIRLLEQLAAQEQHFVVVDLLPGMVGFAKDQGVDHEAFFLPCDIHWSPLGNRAVAEVVTRTMMAEQR